MKSRKNKLILLLSIFALSGCTGGGENGGIAKSNSNSLSVSNPSSNTDVGEDAFHRNEVDTFVEENRIDIETDFESQSAESNIDGNPIDVSTIQEGEIYSIVDGGTYVLFGTNSNARIVVNTTQDVILKLNGVNLTSMMDSPLEVKNASSFKLVALPKTKNTFEDSTNNTLESTILVKKVKLEIEGEGFLYVQGKGLNDDTIDSGVAIQAAKGISVKNTHIVVSSSTSHALNSKAGFVFEHASMKLDSEKDAIHSKEGGVEMISSVLDSDTYGDSVDAFGNVKIQNSKTHVLTHGEYIKYDKSLDTDGSLYEDSKYILENGSYRKISSDDMNRYNTRYYLSQKCKGFKTESSLILEENDSYFVTDDDCLASDTRIDVLTGDYSFYTLDQAINCDQLLNVVNENEEGPSIHIYHSYEGIQGGNIAFYSGDVTISSTDDGINATSDTLADVTMGFYGANVYVDASGDGIDSNGTITMTSGKLFVFGPTSGNNSALDFDNAFTYVGGEIFALSQQGMIQIPSYDKVNVASLNLDSYSSGDILSFVVDGYEFSTILVKDYSRLDVILGSEKLISNKTLSIQKKTSLSQDYINGFYVGESTASGDSINEVTISSGLTSLNAGFGENPFRPGRPGRP